MSRRRLLRLAGAALLLAEPAIGADVDARIEALEQRIEDLELERDERIQTLVGRIEELEASQPEADDGAADWTRFVRLSGSANLGYYNRQDDSVFSSDSFEARDARFFVDAELGSDLRIGGQTVLRHAGLSFEWDLLRLGLLRNTVGDLYVDFQGILDSSWANLQVGRFQIPVGENYLRFGRDFWRNPFISNTVGGPWWWDEGLRAYGSDPEGRFGYVASITAGETPLNVDVDEDNQYTLKLWTDPLPWLHLSASGLYSGEIGSGGSPAQGALWLGEAWARAFGNGTSVPNYRNGAVVPDGMDELHRTWLVAGDAIIDFPEWFRLWLAYGRYAIDSTGGSADDRSLHYWVAELLLYGGLVSPAIADLTLGLRANGLGTYDSDEGYLLDFRYAPTLGYNMESLNAYSVVLGWSIFRHLTLRAEYTHQDIDFVRGVPRSIRRKGADADYLGVDIGAHF
jgi:hypothetical protein